ncbi:MAG TPA: nitronate monooxygenase [Mycobacteriales bacterium]|nr:nitronate monooxygenase [Mycobacteriales bacterium]
MGHLRTPLCERLGIELPIVQAPIGSASCPELAAAVANAGGLGMLAITWVEPSGVTEALGQARALTDKAIGVNLCLAFPVASQLTASLDAGVKIVSTFWGDPAPVSAEIHGAGALHLHTVSTPDEACQAVEAGVDVVVAQGWEAGGHVWGEMATLPLVPAVVDAVDPVPVVAAGGIADGRGLAAVLALGAQAAWLGTRFLTAREARTHHVYRQRVIDSDGSDTEHTGCFDGGWPDAVHRVLHNSTVQRWEEGGRVATPDRPGEGDVVARDSRGREHLRYSDLMPLPDHTGELEAMALYAGQSAGLVHDVVSAGDLVARIAAEATAVLTRLGDPSSGRR